MGDRSEAEAAFVARLVAREESAFTELVQLYQSRVYALVYRMLGRREEARDVTQEVFVQVFKAIDSFRGDAKLSTWLYRVAVNLSKNRLKYHARRAASAHRDFDGIAETAAVGRAEGVSAGSVGRPDEWIEGVQLEGAVRTALGQIDPEFRQMVVLRDVEGLTYEEICEVTGMARGTVKSRIHRGRKQLRACVERILGEALGHGRGG